MTTYKSLADLVRANKAAGKSIAEIVEIAKVEFPEHKSNDVRGVTWYWNSDSYGRGQPVAPVLSDKEQLAKLLTPEEFKLIMDAREVNEKKERIEALKAELAALTAK